MNLLFEKPKNWQLFVLLSGLTIIMIFIANQALLTDFVIYDYFINSLSHDQTDKVISMRSEWGWLTYISTPVVLVIKIFFTSLCLMAGGILFDFAVTFK